MDTIKIGITDIFLEDMGSGKGKITISDTNRGSFCYWWGAMGSDLKTFISTINPEYFAGKLCNDMWQFSGKESVKNIRRYIREELAMDLPWYKYMAGQKEMREKISELERCGNSQEFVHMCLAIPDSLLYCDIEPWEEKEFNEIMESLFKDEPWNFISNKPSIEYKWLMDIHKKLVKKLKKIQTIPTEQSVS